jgi:hypothetical protein
MIYLFYGSDVEKVREKAFAWVAAARKKQPELAYVRLHKEELTENALEEAALSGGLFVKRLLVLLDDPFANVRTGVVGVGDEKETPLEERLDMLAKSDNAIVILAPKLAASKTKKIAAKATKVYEFNAKENEERRGFNIGLVNALAAKNREKLWLEIVKALRTGDAPEMLHGLLHWKARDLMEKGSRAWNSGEARELSLNLIALLQDSRRKGTDLSLALERFTLSL